MQNIIISSITGLTPPYVIYICDALGNNCQLVDTITSNVPPIDVIQLPDFFSGAPAVSLKIIETNVPCEKNVEVVCSYFGNVLFTFCKCSDLSVCKYTEINPFLTFGSVVALAEYTECWYLNVPRYIRFKGRLECFIERKCVITTTSAKIRRCYRIITLLTRNIW